SSDVCSSDLSCSSTSLAPLPAASATRCSITDRLASASPWLRSWTRATGRMSCFMGSSVVSGEYAGGQLHGDAVQAAVLPDQRLARHLDDLAAREGVGQHRGRTPVGRVIVGRHQYRAV